MTEFQALRRISAYIAENKLQATLEAEGQFMAVEANRDLYQESPGKDFDPEPPDKVQEERQDQRLDAIYDD